MNIYCTCCKGNKIPKTVNYYSIYLISTAVISKEPFTLHDFVRTTLVIHYKSCKVNSTMTPYYTVIHDFGIMHDKSWGIGLVLFAMMKSCHSANQLVGH